MIAYLETSAAAKLLTEETEAVPLVRHLSDLMRENVPIMSSMLLETELRQFAVRLAIVQSVVSELLEGVDLVEPNRSLFTKPGYCRART